MKLEGAQMRFNITIGNPPYNNDIYLDFIDLSYKLSNSQTIMIVPSKWAVKCSDEATLRSKSFNDKNYKFRSRLASHISKIIYFKDTKDIFDIGEPCGIYIIQLDKNQHTQIQLKSICKKNKHFEFENEAIEISNLSLY